MNLHFSWFSDTVNRTLDHKQRLINQQSKTLQLLGTRINDTTGEKLRLSGELQQQEKLRSQKAELTSANQSYDREIMVSLFDLSFDLSRVL